ncbi:hypothetical protein [Aliivibrio fischeri]|uniref:hypothetical protein n=1 Tax=Aliivibrio fischeri TaxID=668 RepID=UPI00080DFDDE|nr:hypothetical protein [Aliivibrio fischeri]OCH42669.1 hypothetical protein A6E02_13875 [Aliivibrio fischeri]OED55632.1 hypothetical protein BEI47_02415 [Aliivibrio fischeri]
MRILFIIVALSCSFPSSAKSVQKYYKEHQPKRCETLNRTLTHVNKLLSFSEGKEYKERLKEKKALKKLRKEKGC